ncbi:MAG TPA: helix-turn-helix domain-containing protein [Sphingomonas sp.]|nr:helix-turn-helix domain-containing protein [Sphingomonas sp.]
MLAEPSAQPNQSLIDGIRTLQALAVSPEPIGCRALARQLELDTSKVNRLLRTLAYLGIARQTTNRKYTPGPGMHVLAAQSLFASGLIHRSLPALERLRRFGHTVAMAVLWHDSVSYLYHAPPGVDSAQAVARIGVLPACTSGIGMALLARLPDDVLGRIYTDREIPGYPGGLPALLERLEEVRRDGFIRLRGSTGEDRHTIAIAVGDPVYAGIGVSGWLPEPATADLVAALRVAADEIGP